MCAGNTLMISAREDGTGTLHGTWSSEGVITVSDKRLKSSITPLKRLVSDKLRDLRPVSFLLSNDPSKNRRYGFIAQELERTFPEVVVDDGQSKAVLYQDLIAVLTVAVQEHQEAIEELREGYQDLTRRVDVLRKWMKEHDKEGEVKVQV